MTNLRNNFIGILLAVAGFSLVAQLGAQVEVVMDGSFVLANDDGGGDDDSEAAPGINPAPADGRFLALSEKLDRYLRHEKWPEAFAVLNAFDELPDEGFADWQGVHRPWRQAILLRLLDLPPAGRQAYGLFNDPRAEAELAELGPAPDADTLNRLARKWFLTAVGPELADRAAIAAYRRGQFHQAAEWWQLLRRHHPATGPTAANRILRQVFALKRAGSASAASAAAAEAGPLLATTVTVGGREMPLREALPELTVTAAGPLPPDLTIDPAPVWHHAFFDQEFLETQERVNSRNFQRAFIAVEHTVPDADVAATGHVIVNWRHALLALELKTGRLVWRDMRLSRMFDPKQTYRMIQYYPAPAPAVAGKHLLTAIRRDRQRSHGKYALYQIDAASGETIWSSEKRSDLRNFRVITDWLITPDGDALCAGYQQGSKMELAVIRISASDLSGDPKDVSPTVREIAPLNVPNNIRHTLSGVLRKVGAQYYLALSTGQLAGIDGATLELQWVTQTAELTGQRPVNSYYYRYGYQPLGNTDLIEHENRVIVKQPNSVRITAVNTVDGMPVWHRPCLHDTQLITRIDDHFIIAADGGLSALSTADGKLAWHAPLPEDYVTTRPIVTRNQLLILTRRGIVVLDRHTGQRLDLIRGHDVGATASVLRLHENHLIAVTAAGVTAYAVSPATGATP